MLLCRLVHRAPARDLCPSVHQWCGSRWLGSQCAPVLLLRPGRQRADLLPSWGDFLQTSSRLTPGSDRRRDRTTEVEESIHQTAPHQSWRASRTMAASWTTYVDSVGASEFRKWVRPGDETGTPLRRSQVMIQAVQKAGGVPRRKAAERLAAERLASKAPGSKEAQQR
jgi:hypothetical protein